MGDDIVKISGHFQPGHDPRRGIGGGLTKEVLEAKRLFQTDLPAAHKRLLELMEQTRNANVALQAVVEIHDRAFGKARQAEDDAGAQLQSLVARMRDHVSPSAYREFLDFLVNHA